MCVYIGIQSPGSVAIFGERRFGKESELVGQIKDMREGGRGGGMLVR